MELLLTKRPVKPRAAEVVANFVLGALGTMAAVWFLIAARRDLLSMNGDLTFWIGR
jgi:hypothetical protein